MRPRAGRSAATFLPVRLTMPRARGGGILYRLRPISTSHADGLWDKARLVREAELQIVRPAVVVCWGATAAQSVFDKTVRVQELAGRLGTRRWRQTSWSLLTLRRFSDNRTATSVHARSTASSKRCAVSTTSSGCEPREP